MHKPFVAGNVCLSILIALMDCTPAAASVFSDESRYDDLQLLLGAGTPTGAGVRVMHVEANNDPNLDMDGQPLDGGFDFVPDPANADFLNPDKTFNVLIPPGTTSADISAHATGTTGQPMYGNLTSIAPGVLEIDVLLSGHWLQSGLLNAITASEPLVVPPGGGGNTIARVANHSWIGSGTSDESLDILQRLDWLIHTDNIIQIAGVNNSPSRDATNPCLLSGAFNAITAGRTEGNHATSTFTTLGSLYVAWRTKPDLVVPGTSSTSNSAARMTSAAAVLIQVGHDGALQLSHGSQQTRNAGSPGPPNRATIFHAENSEVIRAAFMAGASRADVTASDNAGFNDIYTVSTSNGLDARYGAGELDMVNSYEIITAGEQDSREEGNLTDISASGFDYDPSFTDADGATYDFTISVPSLLAATLVWNVDIDIDDVVEVNNEVNPNLTNAATLYDLDLLLIDRSSGTQVAGSQSTIENTENIYLPTLGAGDYSLSVVPKSGQSFTWDYGLAWRFEAIPGPGSMMVWLGLMLGARRRRWVTKL